MTLKELKDGVKRLKAELSALIGGEVKCAAVKTDKAVLVHDAEDSLEVGIDVFVEDEEGNRTPAPDGEYVTEERTKIVVADGKVKEITEIEKDGEAETETETEVNAEEESPYLTREEAKEIYKEINELYKLVEGLMKKAGTDRDALDGRLAKVEKMSAGQHPAESFKNDVTPTSTGDKSVDAKLARVSAMFKK